jgi:SOS-response transcriptional repressor LexA
MSSTKSHLTHKQRKVLNAIDSYIIKNQKSPTISELRELLKYSSTRTVLNLSTALEKKNVIYSSKRAS